MRCGTLPSLDFLTLFAAMNTSAAPEATPATPSLSPRALLKSLQSEFPVFRDCQPLAIGVDKALLAKKPELEKKVLRIALSLHTHGTRYLRNMEKATHRFDLDGNQADPVTDEHRQHAAETLKERLKQQAEAHRARKKEEREAEAQKMRAEKLQQLADKFKRP